MDLSIYDIILGPVMTEKAYKSNRQLKKLVLRIHPQANKPQVKEAVERLFDVKVENVRTLIRKGKIHRVNRLKTQKSSTKKAIVTLKEGYSVDIWEQPGATIAPSDTDKGKADKALAKPGKGVKSA